MRLVYRGRWWLGFVETYDIQVDQQRRALWLGPWQLVWHVSRGHGRMIRRGVTAWTR